MQDDFYKILATARQNFGREVWQKYDTESLATRFLQGIINETDEIRTELKADNEVYLTDELGDIAWDYLMLLVILEQRGLISSVDEVFARAYEKYKKRALANSQKEWDEIKLAQKARLKERHQDKYEKGL